MSNINDQDLLFFIKEGCTLEELAYVFNCHAVTISRYKKKLGIQRNNKAPKVINNTKECTLCKKIKHVTEYYADSNNKLVGLRAKCKDCMNLQSQKHYVKNKDYYAEKHLRYKFKKKAAIPAWYSELDELVLQEMYTLAKLRKNMLGIEYHVDHIIPIQGDNVCGLHWHKNWQLIPAEENLSKSNKLLEKYING
jgi:hypothetical protein